ncbi:transcription activator effector-binding protein, partial [Paenibacillus durus]|uniref:transcription activator effector-binding protein n=1 Tax=Paenibacillus durus TaxID=44251 RepID=UPI0005A96180
MVVHIEEKHSFTVIGKMGQGLSSESTEWIPKLWQEANQNFGEISSLAKKDSAGNLVGI